MATFNVVAQLQLQAPTNLNSIAGQIKNSFKNISAEINLKIASGTSQGLSDLRKGVVGLESDLRKLASTSINATSALSGLSRVSGIGRNVAQISQSVNQAASATQKYNQITQEAVDATEQFGRAAGLAGRRFLGFSIVAGASVSAVAAIKLALVEAIKFEREFIKLTQLGGVTKSELSSLNQEISRLSSSLGVSSKDLISTSVTLRQAGLSVKEVKTALEALAKTSLAPTFENIQKTTEGSIAILSQFRLETNQLEGALGSINSVAANFAVESSDLITAVQKAGGAFRNVGGDLNEFLALFTSVRSTTRESADSIATGLRTIFTRLQRKDTVDALREMGINLRYTRDEALALNQVDLENQFVGGYEAVRRLSEGLKNIRTTDPRYSAVIEQLGGYRQISRVIPLIQEFETAQRALAVAQSSSISLTTAAEEAQKTFIVRMEKTKEAFLALGRTIVSSDSFQGFLDTTLRLANAFIKLSEALSPLIPLLTTFATVKVSTGLTSFFTGVSSGFSGQTPKRLSRGGIVPGIGNTDTVPAMLTPGEYVIRKQAAESIGYDNLHRINFSSGGIAPLDYANRVLDADIQSSITRKRISDEIKKDKKNKFSESLFVELPRNKTVGQVYFQSGANPSDKSSVIKVPKELNSKILQIQKFAKLNELDQKAILDRIFLKGKVGAYQISSETSAFKQLVGNVLKSVDEQVNKVPASSTYQYSVLNDMNASKSITGFILEGFISRIVGKSSEGGSSPIDFILSPSEAKKLKPYVSGNKIDARFLDAKLTSQPSTSILDKAARAGLFDEVLRKTIIDISGNFDATDKGYQFRPKSREVVQFKNFGGSIEDTVPAMLTPGEYVIRKQAAQKIGLSNLERMNKTGRIKGYNKGGPVQYFATGGNVEEDSFAKFNAAIERIVQKIAKYNSVLTSLEQEKKSLDRDFSGNTKSIKEQEVVRRQQISIMKSSESGTEVYSQARIKAIEATKNLKNLKEQEVSLIQKQIQLEEKINNIKQRRDLLQKKINTDFSKDQNRYSFQEYTGDKNRFGSLRQGFNSKISEFQSGEFGQRISGVGILAISAAGVYGSQLFDKKEQDFENRVASGNSADISFGISGAMTGAGAGAAAGSAFGAIGVVAGGVVGGLQGLISALNDANKKILSIRIEKTISDLNSKLSNIGENISLSQNISFVNDQLNDLRKQNIELAMRNTLGYGKEEGFGARFISNLINPVSTISDAFGLTNRQVDVAEQAKNSLRANFASITPLIIEAITKDLKPSALKLSESGLTGEKLNLRANNLVQERLSKLDPQSLSIIKRDNPKLVDNLVKDLIKTVSSSRIQLIQNRSRTDIENLASTFRNLNDNIDAVSASFKGLQQESSLLKDLFFNSFSPSLVSDRTDSLKNGFIGQNQADFRAGINQAGNFLNSDSIKNFGSTLADIGAELGNLVKDIYTQPGDKDNISKAEQLIKSLDDRFKNLPFGEEIIRSINSELLQKDDNFSVRARNLNPSELAKELLVSVSKITESFSEATQKFTQASNNYIAAQNEAKNRQLQINNEIDKLRDLEFQKLKFDTKNTAEIQGLGINRSNVTLAQSEAFFSDKQFRLAGNIGNDPIKIGNRLRDVFNEIGLAREKQQLAFDNLKGGDPASQKAFTDSAQKLSSLQTEAIKLQKALSNLSDASNRSAEAQNQLERIEKEKLGRLDIREKLLTNDPRQNAELSRGVALASRVYNQGNINTRFLNNLGFEDRKLLFDSLRQLGSVSLPGLGFGGLLGEEVRNKILTATFPNRNPLTPQQQNQEAEARKKIDNNFNTAIQAQAQLINSQETINNKLIVNMENVFSNFIDQLQITQLKEQKIRNNPKRVEDQKKVKKEIEDLEALSQRVSGVLIDNGLGIDSDGVKFLASNRARTRKGEVFPPEIVADAARIRDNYGNMFGVSAAIKRKQIELEDLNSPPEDKQIKSLEDKIENRKANSRKLLEAIAPVAPIASKLVPVQDEISVPANVTVGNAAPNLAVDEANYQDLNRRRFNLPPLIARQRADKDNKNYEFIKNYNNNQIFLRDSWQKKQEYFRDLERKRLQRNGVLPLAPVMDQPLAPVAAQPLAPVPAQPLAPVVAQPLAPVAAQPLAPGGANSAPGQNAQNINIQEPVNNFSAAIGVFKNSVDLLVTAMSKIPTQLTGDFTHTVNVNITGAEALTSLSPELGKIAEQKAKEVLSKYVKTYMPESGIVEA